MVEELDFYVEFNTEVPEVTDEIETKVEDRLFALQEGSSDLIGASCSIEHIGGDAQTYMYQVRILIYMRPEDVVVIEKGTSLLTTVQEALSSVERKVREKRKRLKEQQQKPPSRLGDDILKLSGKELFDTFDAFERPTGILIMTRQEVAQQLMLEGKLQQEKAYLIADKMIEYAEGLRE
jgi:ribosome-associated translation inhibitor RaiA